jgi:CubicO group peptidase (beta-lactamase class C family)
VLVNAATVEISGSCAPGFELVRDELARNFAERGEVGASVCITVEGETVVDLWGGTADPATGAPWNVDTVAVVMSATKGATSLCAHLLAARGKLDLRAPVTDYWPEYGQAGKERTRVWMLCSHQSGNAAVRTHLEPGAAFDWDRMVDLLARQEPFWEPGRRHGYHATTMGWLVGEVVRRVSGRSLGAFFREEIAAPLGLEFWIGMPEALEPRVAAIVNPPRRVRLGPSLRTQIRHDTPLPLLVFNNTGTTDPRSREMHAVELGGGGGIANARALARMYAPLALGGSFDGVDLVDRDAIADMNRIAAAGWDESLRIYTRFTCGFYKTWPTQTTLSEDSFGHLGSGGAAGFADPSSRMSFGYVPNAMDVLLETGRAQSVVDAAYRCVGYRTRASGSWIR